MTILAATHQQTTKIRNKPPICDAATAEKFEWVECPMWMAPALQGLLDGLAIRSGAVLLDEDIRTWSRGNEFGDGDTLRVRHGEYRPWVRFRAELLW